MALQLLGILLSCWPPGFSEQGAWYLLLLGLPGGVLALWTLKVNPIGNFSAYPEPKPQARLITHGPYRFIRHPMYLSLCLMMMAIATYNGLWINALGPFLVVISVCFKASREERLLVELFGSAYQTYRQRSWRVFPGLF